MNRAASCASRGRLRVLGSEGRIGSVDGTAETLCAETLEGGFRSAGWLPYGNRSVANTDTRYAPNEFLRCLPFEMNEGWVLRRTAERRMGFWFFGPVTWRFGGGKGPKGGRVTFFGAFLTLPLMGWNAWQWCQLPDGSEGSSPEAPSRIDDRDELE